MRRTLLAVTILCLSVSIPLRAETIAGGIAAPAAARTAPGAVAQFMAAQTLFALGRSQKDPLAVLAAARLSARLQTAEADRSPDPAAEPLPPGYPDATTMFTAARALAAGDEAIADLVARSEAETARLPGRSLLRNSTGIAGGASQSYRLSFFAGSLAEIGLLGDGKANLDMTVALADDTLCLDTNPTDHAFCAFVLTENASVTVVVTNRSNVAASYSVLTN